MDSLKIGSYIKNQRIIKNLTQKDLADKLHISFQAVSKWELGETLPDTSILLDLASILDTSVDLILNGGVFMNNERKQISVKDIIMGFEHLKDVKRCFGEESLFYKGMINGINKEMNFDYEDGIKNYPDIMYTEVILQAIINENKTVNMDEVKAYIKNPKMIDIINKKIKEIM